MGYKKEGKWRF
jgi:hypothetical protein